MKADSDPAFLADFPAFSTADADDIGATLGLSRTVDAALTRGPL
jgi:hypothetical protein